MTTQKTIVMDTWTEYERGWGSRPDGMSIHLSVADHKEFVDEFNKNHNNLPSAPDEYTTADNRPTAIDVEESLYQLLVALKAEGKVGMFVQSREDEKLVRAGKDPHKARAARFTVRMENVAGNPNDPLGTNVSLADATRRVELLRQAGIACTMIDA